MQLVTKNQENISENDFKIWTKKTIIKLWQKNICNTDSPKKFMVLKLRWS